MESRVCGKVVGVAQEWTISSPTFLVVDSLDLWVDMGVDQGMEGEGEERTWFTHSSTSHGLKVYIRTLHALVTIIAESLNSHSFHVSAIKLVEHTLH